MALFGSAMTLAGFVAWQILGTVEPWIWILWGGGGLLLCIAPAIAWHRLLRWGGLRGTLQGANHLAMVILMLAIVVVINHIVRREKTVLANWRWDVTANKQHTLSDLTVRILQDIGEDIKITAFYSVSDPGLEEVQDLLSVYETVSNRVKVSVVDYRIQVAFAAEVKDKYRDLRFPCILVETSDHGMKAMGTQERDITSSLIRLISPDVKRIYFTSGHGERNPNNYEDVGYSRIASDLKALNREIALLDLRQNPKVPEDCACLVIASPEQDFEPMVLDALDEYLSEHGRALVLLDPLSSPSLSRYMEKWGAKVGNDLVFDYICLPGDNRIPYITSFDVEHEIIRNRRPVFFPVSRSVQVCPPSNPFMRGTEIIRASKQSWGETTLPPNRPRFDEGVDLRGPVPLVVVLEEQREGEGPEGTPGFGPPPNIKGPRTRIVVAGDSDFAANMFVAQNPFHSDLFLNMVNWLVDEEALIAIAPKLRKDSHITINTMGIRMIMWSCVILGPLGILFLGGAIWWQRR